MVPPPLITEMTMCSISLQEGLSDADTDCVAHPICIFSSKNNYDLQMEMPKQLIRLRLRLHQIISRFQLTRTPIIFLVRRHVGSYYLMGKIQILLRDHIRSCYLMKKSRFHLLSVILPSEHPNTNPLHQVNKLFYKHPNAINTFR